MSSVAFRVDPRGGLRTSGYEAGFPLQEAWLNGRWQPDPLVFDDQALIIDIKDKGLLVITGCGHAGIVNICRYARRLVKERPLHAIMGRFHLNGPIFGPLIPRVLDDLGALAPRVVVPAHCTGWRAQHADGCSLRRRFHPEHGWYTLRNMTLDASSASRTPAVQSGPGPSCLCVLPREPWPWSR